MRLTLVTVVAVLALASPAHGADELLGSVPGATGLSAYGGWVVFSSPTGSGAWTLTTWHDGVVADAGVTAAAAPFDVDVGPDASGRPTAVYSRCASHPFDAPPARCDLFALTLGVGSERRLPISSRRHSEFAPSIWRGRLAFGRVSQGQRKADVMLARGGRLRRLGPGTLPTCGEIECDENPSKAWPVAMDLGSRALAYLWELSGGDTYGGSTGFELRVTRLDRRRARIAQGGFVGGACELFRPHSPNIAGRSVRYGFAYGDSCMARGLRSSFRRFSHATARRAQVRLPGPWYLASLAWDGAVVYWVRRDRSPSECAGVPGNCVTELLRTRRPAFQPIRGGEDVPPLF